MKKKVIPNFIKDKNKKDINKIVIQIQKTKRKRKKKKKKKIIKVKMKVKVVKLMIAIQILKVNRISKKQLLYRRTQTVIFI